MASSGQYIYTEETQPKSLSGEKQKVKDIAAKTTTLIMMLTPALKIEGGGKQQQTPHQENTKIICTPQKALKITRSTKFRYRSNYMEFCGSSTVEHFFV